MKIRTGYVSNSSSSSFILCNEKSISKSIAVLSDCLSSGVISTHLSVDEVVSVYNQELVSSCNNRLQCVRDELENLCFRYLEEFFGLCKYSFCKMDSSFGYQECRSCPRYLPPYGFCGAYSVSCLKKSPFVSFIKNRKYELLSFLSCKKMLPFRMPSSFLCSIRDYIRKRSKEPCFDGLFVGDCYEDCDFNKVHDFIDSWLELHPESLCLDISDDHGDKYDDSRTVIRNGINKFYKSCVDAGVDCFLPYPEEPHFSIEPF